MGRYAMVYATTAAFPQTITQTPTKLGYISAYTIQEGARAVVGENSVIIKVPGAYFVEASITFSIDANTNIYLSVYKNGQFTGFISGQFASVSGVSNLVVLGSLDLDEDDVVELYMYSGTDSSYLVTVQSAQLVVRSE